MKPLLKAVIAGLVIFTGYSTWYLYRKLSAEQHAIRTQWHDTRQILDRRYHSVKPLIAAYRSYLMAYGTEHSYIFDWSDYKSDGTIDFSRALPGLPLSQQLTSDLSRLEQGGSVFSEIDAANGVEQNLAQVLKRIGEQEKRLDDRFSAESANKTDDSATIRVAGEVHADITNTQNDFSTAAEQLEVLLKQYNSDVTRFPNRLVARMMGFARQDFNLSVVGMSLTGGTGPNN